MKEKTQGGRGRGCALLVLLVLHQETNGGEPTDADWLLSQQCIALRGRHRGREKNNKKKNEEQEID